jgi:hypothetical protein
MPHKNVSYNRKETSEINKPRVHLGPLQVYSLKLSSSFELTAYCWSEVRYY